MRDYDEIIDYKKILKEKKFTTQDQLRDYIDEEFGDEVWDFLPEEANEFASCYVEIITLGGITRAWETRQELETELDEYLAKVRFCNICGKPFTGWGNDAWPVTLVGECCNDCALSTVLPARMKQQ